MKKKYFKIEKSQTAPAAASWSAEAVKQRALQEAADQRALRRAQLVRRHVKRSPLRRKIVPGGLLSRELGADYVLPAGAEDGRRAVGTTAAGDVRVAAWVDGVQRKGGIPLARARFPGGRRTAGDDDDDEAARANVACFWVGGEVAYASTSGYLIFSFTAALSLSLSTFFFSSFPPLLSSDSHPLLFEGEEET